MVLLQEQPCRGVSINEVCFPQVPTKTGLTATRISDEENVQRISRVIETQENEVQPADNVDAKGGNEESAGISYISIERQGISDENLQSWRNKNALSNKSKLLSTSFGAESNLRWSSHNLYRSMLFISLLGFGSWWRFPATAYAYHEGTFVFVYIILWVFIGVPVSLLEQALGQFSSRGPYRVWSCVPLFRGLAFAQCAVSLYLAMVFGSLVAWCGLYFTTSLHEPPKWTPFNGLPGSEYFFRSEILHLAPLDQISQIYWQPLVSFAVCWILVVLVTVSKISIFEKLMAVPCVIFFVGFLALLGYVCTMDNIGEGAKRFFQPQWDQLKDGKVWFAALSQLVYTEAIGLGLLISLSSRNEFKWHLYISSSVCSLVGLLFSIGLGVVNFCIIGHFAQTDCKDGSKPVSLGYGLMFISIFETTRNLGSDRFWTAFVFGLLFLAGIGCCASAFFNMKTILVELWPSFRRRQFAVVILLGVLCMALSVPFTTEGSLYFVKVTDIYGISGVAVGCLFFETLALTWIYGTNSLFEDFQLLTGWAIFYVWIVSIATAAPILILGLVVFAIVSFEAPTLDGAPIAVWGHALGVTLVAIPFLIFVGWLVYVTTKQYDYGIRGKLKASTRASYSWGPIDAYSRGTWLHKKTSRYKSRNQPPNQNGSQPNDNAHHL